MDIIAHKVPTGFCAQFPS